MKIYLFCWGIVIAFLAVFYIWGRSFLSIIKARTDVSSSILFGFMAVLLSYQIPYLMFFLNRGSYRTLSLGWFVIAAVITVFLLVRLIRKKAFPIPKLSQRQWVSLILVFALGAFICVYNSLHVPGYGPDINQYISTMNKMYSDDTMWIEAGVLNIHNGANSFFGLLTVPSLILGIRPYYVSLFSGRIMLVILGMTVFYRIGKIVFGKGEKGISVCALWMSTLVAVIIMFWNSMYQAHFFYRRSNEAKAYCQFVLLPLGFSVFLEMCRGDLERTPLWKEQLLVGLTAIAVSMSSLTGYPLLVFIGMAGILAYDKMKKGLQTG